MRIAPLLGLAASLAAGCSAGSGEPATDAGGATSASSRPAPGAPLGAEEKAACDGKGYASLKCLVAARARRIAGDEPSAKALLDLGCKNGDLEACLDAGQDEKVAAACKTGASVPEHAVACQRHAAPDVVTDGRLDLYQLKVKEALALRSKHGPALIAQLEMAKQACAPTAIEKAKSASLAGTDIANQPGLVDAAILCPDSDLAVEMTKQLKERQGFSSPPTTRTLRDGFYRGGAALDVNAPIGEASLGVSCPSRLAADREAVDVWLTLPSGKDELLIVMAVPAEGACVIAERERNIIEEDRAFVAKMLAPRRVAVEQHLEAGAKACDTGMPGYGKVKVAVDAAALGAAAAELKCEYGPVSFIAGSAGTIDLDGRHIDGHLAVDGIVARTTLYTEAPKRAVMSFRRRDASLAIEIKDVPLVGK